MTKSCDDKISLDATRKAVGSIKDECIRRDIMHFVLGAEACLDHGEIYVALDCVKTVVTTVVALNRTISPEVTAGILEGLIEDSEGKATALRRGFGFTKYKDEKCDIIGGTPIGSSQCISQLRSTCYTFSSGSGCGGTSGFQFVWDSAIRASG
ncbi:MAG: hypothetical protein IID48_19885 [Proteobacteria bacterium]|nr:hypothetical protein [Pseudomonadota bacterium]